MCYKPLATTVTGCLANDFSNHCLGSCRSKSKRSPPCLPGQYAPSTVLYTDEVFLISYLLVVFTALKLESFYHTVNAIQHTGFKGLGTI